MKALAGSVAALKILRQCCETTVFQIFIGITRVKLASGAQMNTNFARMPVCGELVHTLQWRSHRKNAQKFSKMPPR
jgi:hypothetical protein